MRFGWISIVVAIMLAASLVSRAGNSADAAVRSHCTAIGQELRVRASVKSKDIAELRKSGADPAVLAQWDGYITHIDAMGRTLIDTFSDPAPPYLRDVAAMRRLDLEELTHVGEACTGQDVRK